jgi:hypothetical protein
MEQVKPGANITSYGHFQAITGFNYLIDLTDVCPLLTKQYKQVE